VGFAWVDGGLLLLRRLITLGRSSSEESLPVRSRALCVLESPRSIVPSRILIAEMPNNLQIPGRG
jgi:hypothetical protein